MHSAHTPFAFGRSLGAQTRTCIQLRGALGCQSVRARIALPYLVRRDVDVYDDVAAVVVGAPA